MPEHPEATEDFQSNATLLNTSKMKLTAIRATA
jgi:hypothetical protein